MLAFTFSIKKQIFDDLTYLDAGVMKVKNIIFSITNVSKIDPLELQLKSEV